eukprot:GFKZ01013447.1.p1 GENE.GFKZ01013447.1~~GFKZ01013447.1.p1  ORF type:complete len:105 (-),score=5.98 GFKZ01013447.1:462-776(-)
MALQTQVGKISHFSAEIVYSTFVSESSEETTLRPDQEHTVWIKGIVSNVVYRFYNFNFFWHPPLAGLLDYTLSSVQCFPKILVSCWSVSTVLVSVFNRNNQRSR